MIVFITIFFSNQVPHKPLAFNFQHNLAYILYRCNSQKDSSPYSYYIIKIYSPNLYIIIKTSPPNPRSTIRNYPLNLCIVVTPYKETLTTSLIQFFWYVISADSAGPEENTLVDTLWISPKHTTLPNPSLEYLPILDWPIVYNGILC